MIINKANLAFIFTALKTVFQGAFEGAQSHWERVAMVVPSTTAVETYAWLGALPRFREWVGERVVNNLKSWSYSIRNLPFEVTIGIPRDNIEDDQYGVYKPAVQELGLQAKTHPDELVFGLLARGETEKCYDGQNFFDADHPVIDEDGVEQSVSNLLAGASTPWYLLDTSRAVKPLIFQKRRDYTFVAKDQETDDNVFMRREFLYGVDARVNAGFGLWQLAIKSKADLTTDNYAAARAAMQSFKADGGKPLGVRPTLLLVPPSLEKKAFEVIKAERDAAGATNVYQGTAEVVVCPWLA